MLLLLGYAENLLDTCYESGSVAFGLNARDLTVGFQPKGRLDEPLGFTLQVPLKVEDLKVIDEAQSDHKFLRLRIEHVLGVRLEFLDSLVILGNNQKK